MNLVNNTDFVFNTPYQFKDRFSGADDFYKYKDDIEPDPVRGLAMRRTNFVPDVIHCDLPLDNRRSPGWRRVEPFMTGNTFYLWIGQHENGRYSKAHAHTSAAVLICLTGKGYTYTWPERYGVNPWKDGHADKVKRVDYEPFGMVSAAPGGARWYHQHFGASKEPFRLTAWFGPHNPGREPGPPGREAHRLHRHGHPGGRHRDPLLDGGSVPARGIRRQAQGRRRREPDGERFLPQGRHGAEVRGRLSATPFAAASVERGTCPCASRELLLLPARGEKGGMRGPLHKLRLAETPPHPNPLPASGAREPSETAANPSSTGQPWHHAGMSPVQTLISRR